MPTVRTQIEARSPMQALGSAHHPEGGNRAAIPRGQAPNALNRFIKCATADLRPALAPLCIQELLFRSGFLRIASPASITNVRPRHVNSLLLRIEVLTDAAVHFRQFHPRHHPQRLRALHVALERLDHRDPETVTADAGGGRSHPYALRSTASHSSTTTIRRRHR